MSFDWPGTWTTTAAVCRAECEMLSPCAAGCVVRVGRGHGGVRGREHRCTKVCNTKTNGFVERFNGTVLGEFFRVKMRETFYESVEALPADLDTWLNH